jgi:hypothetical protein
MSICSNKISVAPLTSRRNMLIGAAAMAAAPLITSGSAPAQPTAGTARPSPANRRDRRRLGGLEVSAIGLGCMSMAPGFYNPAPIRARWSPSSAPPSIAA